MRSRKGCGRFRDDNESSVRVAGVSVLRDQFVYVRGLGVPRPRPPTTHRPRRAEGPAMKNDQALRDHVLYLLRGGGAHLSFDKAIAKLPPKLRGVRPAELPFSPWRLLEHMRL